MNSRQTRRPNSDCEQFQDRLQVVLDERLDPTADSELNSHANLCGRCARLLRLQASLWDCVHDWTRRSGRDSNVEIAPVCEYETDSDVTPAGSNGGGRSSGWSGALILACLLLVTVMAFRYGIEWSGKGGASPRSATARVLQPFPRSGGAGRSSGAGGVLAAGMPGKSRVRFGSSERSAFGSVRIGPVGVEAWVAQLNLLNETVSDLPLERISEVPEMTGVQELTDGMRPVAQSVGSVIHVLWRNVPPSRADSREYRMPDTSSRIVRVCVC